MKLKIVVIDFEAPRWLRRTFAVAAPAVAILATGVVLASPPKQWATNDPLTATDLNALNVISVNGVKYSVGATHYCGTGPSMTDGLFSFQGKTGYPAAKAMCQQSLGCNSSPTAHMCDSVEITRSMQLGDAVPNNAWYSVPLQATIPGSFITDDCTGWAYNVSGDYGPVLLASHPAEGNCSVARPVSCCD